MKKLLLFIFATLICVSFSNAQFVASKQSDKYHNKECQWAKRISESNLVQFSTPEQAVDAGYKPCKVCKPTGPTAATNNKTKQTVQQQSAKSDDGRCRAITKKGSRCSRKAQSGSIYCWQHQKN